MKEGGDRRRRWGSCDNIFLYNHNHTSSLDLFTTTSPLFACAHAGTPSFIKKENVRFVVGYADTLFALCTLYFVICTLYFDKNTTVFLSHSPGPAIIFNGSWISGHPGGTHDLTLFIPQSSTSKVPAPNGNGTKTLNFELYALSLRRVLLPRRRGPLAVRWWFPGAFMRRLLLYERRSTRSRFIGVGGGNCDLKPFYGDFVSLHRPAQLPRHPSDATPSFIKKGTDFVRTTAPCTVRRNTHKNAPRI